MKRNTIIKIFIYFIALNLSNCSSFEMSKTNKIISGKVYVIGNEPFTNIALFTFTKEIYVLKCSKKIREELLKQQGKEVAVYYKESKKSKIGIIIKVIDIRKE